MSSSYRMNFGDLSRFMDDIFYLLQKGGRDKKLLTTGGKEGTVEKVIKYIVLFLKFFVIMIIIYVLYILIFRGYPKILMDFFTLSFYHKEKLDNFIKERNLLIDHVKFLGNPPNKCVSPYAIYANIYDETSLQNAIQKFETIKDKYYATYNYDDKYHNAFKEFYLFYNVYNDSKSERVVNKAGQRTQTLDELNVLTIPRLQELLKAQGLAVSGKKDELIRRLIDYYNKPVDVDIKPIKFYELLVTYKISTGEIDQKDVNGVEKSPDALVSEIYNAEQKKGKELSTLTGITNVHDSLVTVGEQVKTIVESFTKKPITSYVIIPTEDKSITNIINNFTRYNVQIENYQIYDISYDNSGIDDYSWSIIEYITSLYKPDQFEQFASNLPPYKNDEVYNIIYYINLPRDQKTIANRRVMSSISNKDYKDFIEYINKRPIFSHIYFTQQNIGDKKDFYNKVMTCYKLLCECNLDKASINIKTEAMRTRLDNLKSNGYAFKQFIIAASYLHLFLNVYQNNLTRMYSKQIISAKRFFTEMWQPVVNDILVNRIGNYYKLTFSSEGMGSSYKKFHIWYKQLGKDLNRMIKAVFKSFFTGVPIEKPQPTETSN